MINVLVDFSRGGMEWRWWACLWAGALKTGCVFDLPVADGVVALGPLLADAGTIGV